MSDAEIDILLSFIWLLMFIASDVEAMEVVSSIEENSIKPTDASCIYALQENKYFTETEEEMGRKGYSDYYVAGFDHVMENLRLAQSLRDRLRDKSIDPHTLHIPEFAALIDTHK